jgi:hypothetical protein
MMNEMTDGNVIALIITIVILIAMIKGAIKTFQRNWIAALVLLVLLFPIWLLWAFGELFTGEIAPKQQSQVSPAQAVNVNIVNNVLGEQIKRETVTLPRMSQTRVEPQFRTLRDFTPSDPAIIMSDGTTADAKQCHYCAETVKAAAIVCRHCGRDI